VARSAGDSDLAGLLPRFRYGQILSTSKGQRLGTGFQFYRLVPLDVIEVTALLGIEDYTDEDMKLVPERFPRCVTALHGDQADRIVLSGVPIAARLGRARMIEMLAEAEERTGIPCDTTLEAVIAALRRLGLSRVAMGSRWAPGINAAVVSYLAEGGVEVVAMTELGQWGGAAYRMSLADGMRVSLDIGRQAARLGGAAEAIFVPGGAALTLHVVPVLEREFDKPVITNLTAEVWNGLVSTGIIQPVDSWGTLLAGPVG
jgi:maleate cis-trans isomerase